MSRTAAGAVATPTRAEAAKAAVRRMWRRLRFQLTLLWARTGYRPTARLLHRFNLHHTCRIGPLAPDGAVLHRCEWCGVSRTDHTIESLRRKIAAFEPKPAGTERAEHAYKQDPSVRDVTGEGER